MAYAWKRGKKYWSIGWTDSAGVPRQKATKCTTKTQALDVARDLERRADRARRNLEPEPEKDITFEEAAWKWFAQLGKRYRSKKTAEAALRHRILPYLGQVYCRAMRRRHVRAMLLANEVEREAQDSKGRGITLVAAKPAMLEKLRLYVHAIFQWLNEEEREDEDARNPAAGKRMRVKVPKRLPRYIPIPELVALLAHVPECYRLLFVFAVVSGARKGELIPLTWPDVRLEERRVFITKSGDSDTTKTGVDRAIPIPAWLLPMFEAEREKRWSQYVFPNSHGKRHRLDVKLARMVRTAAKAAGLVTGYEHICRRQGCRQPRETLPDRVPRPCPACGFMSWVEPIPKHYLFKDLRSTFATLVAAESSDLRHVQQMLGHGSLRTTETSYVHALTGQLARKTDALTTFNPLAAAVSELSGARKETVGNGLIRKDWVHHEVVAE